MRGRVGGQGEGCDADAGILRSTRQPVFRPWTSPKPTGANKLRDSARAAANIYSGTTLNRRKDHGYLCFQPLHSELRWGPTLLADINQTFSISSVGIRFSLANASTAALAVRNHADGQLWICSFNTQFYMMTCFYCRVSVTASGLLCDVAQHELLVPALRRWTCMQTRRRADPRGNSGTEDFWGSQREKCCHPQEWDLVLALPGGALCECQTRAAGIPGRQREWERWKTPMFAGGPAQ